MLKNPVQSEINSTIEILLVIKQFDLDTIHERLMYSGIPDNSGEVVSGMIHNICGYSANTEKEALDLFEKYVIKPVLMVIDAVENRAIAVETKVQQSICT